MKAMSRAIMVVSLLAFSFNSSLADEVNVMIGTGGYGFGVGSDFPGACVPFGMMRPGPDSSYFGSHVSFHHCTGYHYGDNMIRGFSHTRLSGIGVPDYGNLRIMPTYFLGGDYSWEGTYTSPFTHKMEEARPGYYSVVLLAGMIKAELTASAHAAVHRYTFPRKGPARIVIDADRAIMNKQSCGGSISFDQARNEFTGRTQNCGALSGRDAPVEIFFVVRFESPVVKHGFFGEQTGAWAEVGPDKDHPVIVKAAISFISVDQAVKHLETEVGEKDFDTVLAEAEKAWADVIGKIEITGGTADQRTIFKTALYHSMIMPTDFTEAGGLYRGFDEKVHEAGEYVYYTDFSLWDTFRTLHPFLDLVEPHRSRDMMQSLTRMAEQGGYMPRWPTAYRYTNCMIGANADNALAGAYLKGITGFDYETAYAKSRWLALNPVPKESFFRGREGIDEYIEHGYVFSDKHGGAASWTIEMSYNDWCLARWAKAMGKDGDYRMFMKRASNWRNLYDPQTGFIRGKKSDGSFEGKFMESSWTGYYTEGNARQWLWAPLHDVPNLIETVGGREKFIDRLETFFEKSTTRPNTILWDTFYWHGNEPDIHASYLFLFGGRPELTQKWVRWAMEKKYKNAPAGYDGNDDCGTLAAWYIFSALGFYPIAGSDVYIIGSPVFDRAVLHLPGGDLVVRAEGNPGKNIYVKNVTLNGKPLEHPWFHHADIVNGGEIVFTMSGEPAAWGRGGGWPFAEAREESADSESFIDWAKLKNPVLSVPDRMLKDQVVVYRGGEFFIFASTRFEDSGDKTAKNEPCFYRTRDFIGYKCFYDHDLDVRFGDETSIPGSPDVIEDQGIYYMVFQAGPGEKFRRLYYSTSLDLMDWSPARPLAEDLFPGVRVIDGALACAGENFLLGFKANQDFYISQSSGPSLEGPWQKPLRASAGGKWAENFQFIKLDEVWRMIATARVPRLIPGATYTGNHEPFIYKLSSGGGFREWSDRTLLSIPSEDWNKVMHANSAYLADWRTHDGFYYLFYAGANDSKSFSGRGHGQIGLSRSRDLKTWRAAGDVSF